MHHGHGFIHSDVYNMPVYLRRFYLKKLMDFKEQEKAEYEKINSQMKKTPRRR